jgi:hypothetical protein
MKITRAMILYYSIPWCGTTNVQQSYLHLETSNPHFDIPRLCRCRRVPFWSWIKLSMFFGHVRRDLIVSQVEWQP